MAARRCCVVIKQAVGAGRMPHRIFLFLILSFCSSCHRDILFGNEMTLNLGYQRDRFNSYGISPRTRQLVKSSAAVICPGNSPTLSTLVHRSSCHGPSYVLGFHVMCSTWQGMA